MGRGCAAKEAGRLAEDATVFRRTIRQSLALTVIVVVLAAVARHGGPAIVRFVTRTPDPLAAACEELGARAELVRVSGWAEVDAARSRHGTELHACAWTAMQALVGEQAAREAVLAADFDGSGAVQLSASAENAAYRTSCRLVGKADRARLYLVCEVTLDRPSLAGLGSWAKRVEAALHTLGTGSEQREPVMTTVSALLDGVLTAHDAEMRSRAVAGRLHGSVADVIEGEGYFSALIYATVLGEALSVGGRPVNLGLFFRPDPEGGCTRVFVGTPLYSGDY